MDNKFIRWICRLIPKYVSERGMVMILQLLRRFNRRGKLYSLSHEESNREAFREKISDKNLMIENQADYTEAYIGMAPVSAAGCEAIALYNAVNFLEKKNKSMRAMELYKIISRLEKDGIILSGSFGVAPKAVFDLLKRMGYHTDYYIPNKKNDYIPAFILGSDVVIITYYNDGRDLFSQIHTIAVTKEDCKYTAHNIYCNGYVHGPFDSLQELIGAIGEGYARPIMYISVN